MLVFIPGDRMIEIKIKKVMQIFCFCVISSLFYDWETSRPMFGGYIFTDLAKIWRSSFFGADERIPPVGANEL